MSYRRAIAIREFRSLWLASLQSWLGDQLARIAISVLVYERTGSAAITAITFAMSFLPTFIGGVLLSGLADRFPRRTVLVLCDLARAGAVMLMLVPGEPVVVLCVLLCVEAIVSALFSSAEAALIPDVVPHDVYPAALAIHSTTNQLAQFVGFAVGGVLVALLGPITALSVDVATFLVSAFLIWYSVSARNVRRVEPGRSYRSSISAGITVLASSPRLRILGSLIWLEAFYVAGEGLAVPYARSVGGGAAASGLLLAAGPVGTAVGVIVVTKLITAGNRLRWLGPLAFATGLPLLVCALHPGLVITLVAWGASGVLSGYYVTAASEFTLWTPEQMRSQIVGIAAAILTTAQGLAMVAAGIAASAMGPARAVAVAAAVGMICALVAGLRWLRFEKSLSEEDSIAIAESRKAEVL